MLHTYMFTLQKEKILQQRKPKGKTTAANLKGQDKQQAILNISWADIGYIKLASQIHFVFHWFGFSFVDFFPKRMISVLQSLDYFLDSF